MFIDELDDLINKVNIFGYHFASLDIRQDSRIHSKVFESVFKTSQSYLGKIFPDNYLDLSEEEKVKVLSNIKGDAFGGITAEQAVSTLGSIRAMKTIQNINGEKGSNRYIISNNQNALNILEVFSMFRLSGWEFPSY